MAEDREEKVVKTIEASDWWHLGIGGSLAGIGAYFLICEFPLWYSTVLGILLCLYLASLTLECARLSKKSGSTKFRFDLPNRTWALLLTLFLVLSNVVIFANIYRQSKGIEYEENNQIRIMQDKFDSVYYSAVTVTTLGYGDFTPNREARKYVLFQLFSGLLLIFCIIPVVVSRISSWKS
jgi:hypothetical protein